MIIEVQGSAKSPYLVDTEKLTCTCPNFRYRCIHYPTNTEQHLCKHIKSVFDSHPEYAPSWYTMQNPSEAPFVNDMEGTEDPDGKIRYPRAFFDSYVTELQVLMTMYSDVIDKYEFCGSYRRMCERVSDLDVLIVVKPGKSIDPLLDYLEGTYGYERLWRGDKKASYKTGKVQIDFKFIPEESWPFATLHFTGSKSTNISMRKRALSLGYTLNEYGLKDKDGNTSSHGCKTEEDIFNFLRLNYLNPWER